MLVFLYNFYLISSYSHLEKHCVIILFHVARIYWLLYFLILLLYVIECCLVNRSSCRCFFFSCQCLATSLLLLSQVRASLIMLKSSHKPLSSWITSPHGKFSHKSSLIISNFFNFQVKKNLYFDSLYYNIYNDIYVL